MSNLTLKTPSALASAPTQQTIQIPTKHPATLAATVFRPDTVKAAAVSYTHLTLPTILRV